MSEDDSAPAQLTWSIEYLPDEQLVRVVTRGVITLPSVLEMGREVIAACAARGTLRALVDHRLASPEIATMDIYEMPQQIARIGGSPVHRVAIVFDMTTTRAADIVFYENRMANSGFSHRVFTDPDRALAWLQETTPLPPTRLKVPPQSN